MGWRFHKSVNLGGGTRMNISKSGVGFSFGGNGFRVAIMPDGRIRRTITIPGTGLSYIEDIPSAKQASEEQGTYQTWTGTVNESSQDEVSQYYEKAFQKHFKDVFFWAGKIVVFFALFFIFSLATSLLDLVWLAVPAIASMIISVVISRKRPAPIQIEYESPLKIDAYTKENRFCAEINGCKEVYHVSGATVGIRRRTNAGATQNLDMKKIRILRSPDIHIKTNIECFLVKIKGMDIYVLPDVLVIVKGLRNVKVIETSALRFRYYTDNVIWHQKVPGDSVIVGTTWQNVNNDGSPDRRFKDNQQLSICRFGVIEINHPNGLHLFLYGSNEQKMRSAYESVAL